MFLRLLPLVCLLFLTRTSFPQSAGTSNNDPAPDSCPVTKPSDRPFVPPSPYSARAPKGSFWFGTDRLWTLLPVDGTWKGLGHYTPDDPTFRQKLFYWRQGYFPLAETKSRLTVEGRRLDSPAPALLVDKASNGGWQRVDQPMIVTGINFPTRGCWEITGRYDDDELTFVILVAK